jgi:diguanylate cyclase (GGDEF)-like protein
MFKFIRKFCSAFCYPVRLRMRAQAPGTHVENILLQWKGWKKILFPDSAFVLRKYQDHKYYTGVLFVIGGMLSCSFWGWDYIIDPQGAMHTAWLRAAYLLVTLSLLAALRHLPPRMLFVCCLTAILVTETIFAEIMNRLTLGTVYGIGGLSIILMSSVFYTQCFPLLSNLFYTACITLWPHLLAMAGLSIDFKHAQYGALMWPTAILMMLAQTAIHLSYVHRYILERKLETRSNTDHLTGASNRRYFMPLLDKEVARAKRSHGRLAVLFLDIDHFKRINDTYGHFDGDAVICSLVELCRLAVRETDTIARLGGEEFAVLLPDSNLSHALVVAERIRQSAEQAVVETGNPRGIRFCVSIGAAELLADTEGGHDLLARADARLYQAKSSGRNRVCA